MTTMTETLSDRERRWPLLYGVLVSLIVHGLLLALFLRRDGAAEVEIPVLPIELVTIAERTVEAAPGSQGNQQQAALQQRRPLIPRVQANPNPPSRVAPSRVPEPTNDKPAQPSDALQVKLEELAKLTRPDTDPRIIEGRASALNGAGGNGKGGYAAYSLKDFIRAQVERRWSLDLAALAGRQLTVSIHLVLERDGSLAKAEIVNRDAFDDDETYRSIAISARNAAILSSPFTLPPGSYESVKDIVLDLNPSNIVR